jgi:hypothetical protein
VKVARDPAALVVAHLDHPALVLHALDRRGEHVGDGLHQADVGGRERPPGCGERFKDPERPLGRLDHDARPADGAVHHRDRGSGEALIGSEVLADDRYRRRERVPPPRLGRCRLGDASHDTLVPAQAGADSDRLAGGQQLRGAGQVHPRRPGAAGGRTTPRARRAIRPPRRTAGCRRLAPSPAPVPGGSPRPRSRAACSRRGGGCRARQQRSLR